MTRRRRSRDFLTSGGFRRYKYRCLATVWSFRGRVLFSLGAWWVWLDACFFSVLSGTGSAAQPFLWGSHYLEWFRIFGVHGDYPFSQKIGPGRVWAGEASPAAGLGRNQGSLAREFPGVQGATLRAHKLSAQRPPSFPVAPLCCFLGGGLASKVELNAGHFVPDSGYF